MRRTALPAFLLGLFLIARLGSGQALTTLHEFSGPDGQLPREGLVEGVDGDFYGITYDGGANAFGVFFKVTAAGDYTDLYDFVGGASGGSPVALVRGCDDNFYGLAAYVENPPGVFPAGLFVRLTPAGVPTNLHTFPNDGTEGRPGNTSSLVVAADCDIYGTTVSGGATNNGKIFRLTTAGGYDGVYDFPDLAGPGGSGPQGLTQGSDGLFYGATGLGGHPTAQRGTLFKVDSGGTLTTLHAFTLNDGGATPTWVTETSAGVFHGVSGTGGSTTGGTLFTFTSNPGSFALLHTFTGPELGTTPSGPLARASDGNLYGTSQSTGGFCCGVIFQRTPAGNMARISAFLGAPGTNPMGGLIQGADSDLYGTTFGSSGLNAGTIYKHVLPPSVQAITPSSGPAGGGIVKTIDGTTFVNGATVEVGGAAATGVTFVGPTQLTATVPALTPGTLNDVKVTNPNLAYTTLKNGWFADFLDVPQVDIFHGFVEDVFRRGITAGCGGGNYCRNDFVKRKQMAVFLLKAKFGASHLPPPATGTVFTDVPAGDPFAPWIEELAALGITGGCGGGAYCPENPVRRDQMAIFLLKAFEGSGYLPPACTDLFDDVTCPTDFAVDWIEELYNRAVTGGCVANPLQYCPLASVLRGQMAAFLIRTFFMP